MSTAANTATPATFPTATPAPKESVLQKLWGIFTSAIEHVEAGIEDVFGSKVATDIENAAKGIVDGEYGPLISTALAEATDVATGTMSVSKAISSLVSQFEAQGKSLTKAAALQLIGIAQNALPATANVTPTA